MVKYRKRRKKIVMGIQKSNDHAAYRELFEETGISQDDVKLEHFMDLNYLMYIYKIYT